ncbi:cytochrome c [Arenibaculum sp.]|jgi:mono/diheme cytochrome c family protein|uniref:c-type cytochrome n=1 Tax=Arenibaculum sp. TaxID=2865862 RepID=UPI002E0FC3F0|nr:cytochrome c [Arenibaculum sp.]
MTHMQSVTLRAAAAALGFALTMSAGPRAALAQEAAGEPEAGRRIAETWCVHCHAIDPQAAVTDMAPAFEMLAQERTASQLAAFLTDPHGGMPPLELSRREIEDLVAYIRSLDAR